MPMFTRHRGFSLTEMVITVAVLAILAAIAAPSFQETIQKRRVIGAAEELAANLQYARSEAIKGNRSVVVNFTADGTDTWCYGMDDTPATVCNCSTAAADCTVDTVQRVFTSDGYRGVSMPTPAFGGGGANTGFEPRRGFPTGAAGTIRFISSSSGQVHVVLSPQGRIKLCSPTDNKVAGYSNSDCPLIP